MSSSPGVFIVKDGRPFIDVLTVTENMCQFAVNMLRSNNAPVPREMLEFFGEAATMRAEYIIVEADLAMLDPDTVIV